MTDSHTQAPSSFLHHHLAKMTGRDTEQSHRAATPLELLYDLTLVVAFGMAGNQFAHALADGHVAVAIFGFQFAMFGAVWAWINYTWFASAYDTDDWFVRMAVLVQMGGVIILAHGIPELFHGLEDGWKIHNEAMVLGYVVMRVAMIALWLRAARHDPERSKTCMTYAIGIGIAQIGWIALVLLHLPTGLTLAGMFLMLLFEMLIPYKAETRHSSTPWHPHHIAERYGLLTIIALGEGVIGTSVALEALIATQGWSTEVFIVLAAGLSLTFGCWWMYFNVPAGELLEKRRNRGFIFGYSHLILYSAIAAIGAGLHVAAYAFQGKTELSTLEVALSVAIPVGIFILIGCLLVPLLKLRGHSAFQNKLLLATFLLLGLALVMAAAGVDLGWVLIPIMLAPWINVIGFEVFGHQHFKISAD